MARQNSQFLTYQIVNYFVSVAKEDKAKTARYFMDAEVSQKKEETKRKHVYRIIQRYQNENKQLSKKWKDISTFVALNSGRELMAWRDQSF
jgi:hypothetical protein